MPRFLYIVSLERSGSTPLSYNLGLQPGFVALGEIDRTLALLTRPGGFDGRVCSCGAAINKCPVWSPIAAATDTLTPLGLADRYRLIDRLLEPVLGEAAVIVDGSKPLDTLRAITPVLNDRLSVVHLVKDVRSYLESTLGRMASMDQDRLWSEAIARQPLRARLMRVLPDTLVYLWRWARQNRAMRDWLRTSDLAWLRIGYDDLCEDPEAWFARLAAISHAGGSAGQHHILLGSFGYLDSGGGKRLATDRRWQSSSRRLRLSFAHALARSLNAELARAEEQTARPAHDASPAGSMTT
ncbi:MAG: hypothetical protein HOL02_10385 [Rhodospirillaceae bacterium]|nr:hypothetical protein [Rhodospirillaceae bacterium]MBT6510838.1 hypothetical protein [Rhodospirillaceae bacterium]MBT7613067.1 hypothetical protein [Rhodospirillaceae bacterium]MBT7645991.1 hypothetical protein [Rhodospirillaceae bacterium]